MYSIVVETDPVRRRVDAIDTATRTMIEIRNAGTDMSKEEQRTYFQRLVGTLSQPIIDPMGHFARRNQS